jgi:hypothetical protein
LKDEVMKSLFVMLFVLCSAPCFGQIGSYQQYGSTYDSNAMSLWRNRYDLNPPKIYGADGTYLGRLSINPYVQDSIANPYSQYGSKYSPTSINNPYSPYGGRYSAQRVYVQPRRW